jgi:HAD superfamily hydrolase (TIGR01484 family)
MGRPFSSELNKIPSIIDWSFNIPIDTIQKFISSNSKTPLFIVGSGGSLSACSFISQLHCETGTHARALTPLAIMRSKNLLHNSKILFISSNGNNRDIINAFKTVMKYEPVDVFSLIMGQNSKLGEFTRRFTISNYAELNIPTGKDGFLATNSLLAYFIVFARVYNTMNDSIKLDNCYKIGNDDLLIIKQFASQIHTDTTIHILYDKWGNSIAIDLESKLTEAAINTVLLSDYRNFGHGRHHWFAKRNTNSGIVGLSSPTENELAEMTLSKIPKDIPSLLLQSSYNGPMASIDLLIKIFYLVRELGIVRGIDPGRPGVPTFGRQLYHLNYYSLINKKEKFPEKVALAIKRKIDEYNLNRIDRGRLLEVYHAYKLFVKKLSTAKFGAVIFDYDGTLCEATNRYTGISDKMADALAKLLSNNILVSIVTGRGKSVRESLQKKLSLKYWDKIIIGYYNGSDIGYLNDNNHPILHTEYDNELQIMHNKIIEYGLVSNKNAKLRPKQLTISISPNSDLPNIKRKIRSLKDKYIVSNIKIFESDHSIDIIPSNVSKLNFYNIILDLLKSKQNDILCVGDKGMWPGNDCELLSTPYSLSVDEVSDDLNSCWNLAGPGIKYTDATLYYLSYLKLI